MAQHGRIMGHFYFDESIHERGAFIVGAFVYSPFDLGPSIDAVVTSVGLTPRMDEFKSNANMLSNPVARMLRSGIGCLLSSSKVAVAILPRVDRNKLGQEALKALTRLISANDLSSESHSVYIDQGIKVSQQDLAIISQQDPMLDVHPNQDSKLIPGIQVADLAAHRASGMLLEQMGLVTKMVKAGPNSGYDPDLDIELGFELWAGLRYPLFKQPKLFTGDEEDMIEAATYKVEGFGLFIADSCDEGLRNASLERFGSVYLGCIH